MRDTEFEEVVYLLVDGQVSAELSFESFEQHVDRQLPIEGAPPGATLCRAGFVVVGPELRIEGLVFFLLQVDDHGRPDKNFNVPLPYLAKNAGPGPDLGYGPVPMACRGSCSVPWHANNLWDPTVVDTANPMDALVAAVQANRLGLKPVARVEEAQVETRFDASAHIAELSRSHTAALVSIQRRHEEELLAQREIMEAKMALLQQEILRLQQRLAEQPSVAPISAAQTAAHRTD